MHTRTTHVISYAKRAYIDVEILRAINYGVFDEMSRGVRFVFMRLSSVMSSPTVYHI